MSTNVFFSVGEPSGDQHAARLIHRIGQIQPQINIRGFGGRAMSQAGCDLDLDLTQHAVMGLVEVVPKLREFFRFVDQAEEYFRAGEVDAVVLVDFPGFNWHIAKRAKKYNIPVYYYCPPQLWAWGGWRSRKMRRNVDHVLAVLPIEEKYFGERGIPTTYVGHTFFDAVYDQPLDQELMRDLSQRPCQDKLVAVLPGSRGSEVRKNWPIMLDAIGELSRKHPDAQFLVAAYRPDQRDWCKKQLSQQDQNLPLQFYVGKTSEIIQASHCAMMVSGSVSLELMARQTPAAVIYRIGRLVNAVGKCLVGVDSMTLPNLMGPTKVFPEMLSVGDPRPTVDFLVQTIDAMLGDSFYYKRTLNQLQRLSEQHAVAGATNKAAAWLCDKIDSSPMVAVQPPPSKRAA